MFNRTAFVVAASLERIAVPPPRQSWDWASSTCKSRTHLTLFSTPGRRVELERGGQTHADVMRRDGWRERCSAEQRRAVAPREDRRRFFAPAIISVSSRGKNKARSEAT